MTPPTRLERLTKARDWYLENAKIHQRHGHFSEATKAIAQADRMQALIEDHERVTATTRGRA